MEKFYSSAFVPSGTLTLFWSILLLKNFYISNINIENEYTFHFLENIGNYIILKFFLLSQDTGGGCWSCPKWYTDFEDFPMGSLTVGEGWMWSGMVRWWGEGKNRREGETGISIQNNIVYKNKVSIAEHIFRIQHLLLLLLINVFWKIWNLILNKCIKYLHFDLRKQESNVFNHIYKI